MYNIPNYDPTPSLISAFKCNVGNTMGNYVYDIYWYINGNSVKLIKNVPYDDINSVLKDSDWTDHYHMNMDVSIYNTYLITDKNVTVAKKQLRT